MKPRFSLCRLAWIALLAIAPGIAGSGAIVATLAAFASLDGGPAHRVSIQRDAGHDDFVFCHDARDESDAAGPVLAQSECADDHRLHAASATSLISRHDVAQPLHDAPLAVVASPPIEITTPARQALPSAAPATQVASRHHRTVVLRI